MTPLPPDEYDAPWKEALEKYFPEFLQLFFPAAHADIDWKRGHEFLDKELQAVVRDAEIGRRHVDKLVRVWRKDGAEAWVLIHVEVQGEVEEDFPRRMYVYNYRLFDRYNRHVASFAVLTDDAPGWRPDRFEYELWGCRPGLVFPTVKLLDFEARWDELEQSANPFAVVVMAHLRTQGTRTDLERRLEWKFRIARGMLDRGYSEQDAQDLLRVIDWMMELPEDLDIRFESQLEEYAEAHKMPYVTGIERRAIVRGRLEGLRTGVLVNLEALTTPLPADIRERVEAVNDEETLQRLVLAARRAQSVDEFRRTLEHETKTQPVS